MKVALFDYKIVPTNPIGGCHLRMLRGLSREHEFTVFAVELENPDPERIKWVKIPAPVRPLALLFAAFHLLAPIYYLAFRLRRRIRFDLIQGVETNILFGDVAYSQFCHSAYLRERAPRTRARVRDVLRWLDHALHAILEPLRYRIVKQIIAPSRGLAEEMKQEFSAATQKLRVISNPLAVESLRRPEDFDAWRVRGELGFQNSDVVLIFAALGHFERKGLPLILDALARLGRPEVKLIVVGGEPGVLIDYKRIVEQMGIAEHVHFAGMRRDFRDLLWASDAFVFPSAYETFSLVSFEAAAAGLPLLTSRLHGVEELLIDGFNGFEVPLDSGGIASVLEEFVTLSPSRRRAMGILASTRAQAYSVERFVEEWRKFYEGIARSTSRVPVKIFGRAPAE